RVAPASLAISARRWLVTIWFSADFVITTRRPWASRSGLSLFATCQQTVTSRAPLASAPAAVSEGWPGSMQITRPVPGAVGTDGGTGSWPAIGPTGAWAGGVLAGAVGTPRRPV